MSRNIFNSVALMKPKKNKFDLSHDVKLSCNMGRLTPVMVMETVPGDKIHLSGEALIRFAPMVSPVMHRIDVSIHYFFVPNRILWPNWEKWITGDNSITPPYLTITETAYNNYPLYDYLGVPKPGAYHPVTISPFAAAAYQKIYQEYYMDQNLQTPTFETLYDGDNTFYLGNLGLYHRRNWQHDYFTAALPWAQKGDSVNMPLGKPALDPSWDPLNPPTWKNSSMANAQTGAVTNDNAGSTHIQDPLGTDKEFPVAYDPKGSLVNEPVTINDLRRAFKLQEWLERNARAGTRYVESILAHFGVKSSDARLQRPEYITGVKSPVIVSEIANTTGEAGGLPQGNLAGHGISVAQGKFGSYFCEEHGYIIGIMSVMPQTAYQQGLPKHFTKTSDRFEYFWPSFAHIGEQPVLNKELYVDTADQDGVFGYVPRYAEYKYLPNRVAGQFKTTLDYWHLGRIFGAPPVLNDGFVACIPDDRIFAVTDPTVDHLFCHVLNKVTAIRPMPKFGNPMI